MSATLDVSLFLGYFGGATLHVPGRQFPVQVRYTSEVQADFIDAALITVLQVHTASSSMANQSRSFTPRLAATQHTHRSIWMRHLAMCWCFCLVRRTLRC